MKNPFAPKPVERPIMCPHGCGRSVLPSRMAAHFLISRVDHVVADKQRERFEWALGVLSSEVTA